MRLRLLWLSWTVALVGCPEDEPPKPELELIVRRWSFHRLNYGAVGETPIGDERVQIGGKVSEKVSFGPLIFIPPGSGPNAEAEVFSNETGETYWVSAKAPSATLTDGVAIGNTAELSQYQYFRKTDPNAKLRVVVSKVVLEAIDSNPQLPLPLECPWHVQGGSFYDCRRIMWGWVSFYMTAFSFFDQKDLITTGGFADISGWNDAFDYSTYTHGGSTVHFWNDAKFDFDPDDEGIARLSLAEPISIEVPIASVPVGEAFYLYVSAKAATLNRRQRESYLSAHFRDPSQLTGLEFSYEGLEPIETPTDPPTLAAPAPAPPCPTGPDPGAGTLEFAAPTFYEPELPADGATIVVTRSGGSRGAVSVSLATSDGTAVAGADYAPVVTNVLFADGEDGERRVRLPIVNDAAEEPNETVNLALSAPMGCASLGPQTTAVLTIFDDDVAIVGPTTYTVGGTVTGLAGTGLVLREAITGRELTPGNGPFVFDYAFPSGRDYDVQVVSQPVGPFQVCTVTNASGTVADADVTNVVVECMTLPANGALDPGFGIAGKQTMGLPGTAVAIALQPSDGKIVLLGERTLARYNTDGSPDTSFGTAGAIDIEFNAGFLDEAHGLAIQPDGKIVVVGQTSTSTSDDFAVARYDANGNPDSSFGNGGQAATDFNTNADRAWAVVVQGDGKLVVAGHAATSTPFGPDNDFAVARYSSAGELDMGFGTGGKKMIDIGGRTDLAYAAALQADGKIVVAGRVANGGGDDPDVGLVRLDASGNADGGFGGGGIVRHNFGGWDEASDLVIQPDGKLVVALKALAGASFALAVARFDANGDPDGGFGAGGVAFATFSDKNDYATGVALQADGKIVVVGQSSNLMAPDFAIARHNADGSLDESFDTDGKLTVDFFTAADGAECVAIQPDGKVVVGGAARNGSLVGVGLVRVVP